LVRVAVCTDVVTPLPPLVGNGSGSAKRGSNCRQRLPHLGSSAYAYRPGKDGFAASRGGCFIAASRGNKADDKDYSEYLP